MLPLLLKLCGGRTGDAGGPRQPRMQGEIREHLHWLDRELAGRDRFIGNALTGADVPLSFVAQLAAQFCGREAFRNLTHFVDRVQTRPGYRRALARSGV
jgi:glutathione S-transferase